VRGVELVFAIGWAAFWVYWLVAAFSTKRGRVLWSRELRIRATILVLAIVLIRVGAFRGHGLNSDPWRAGVGLTLFAAGLAFAIWARIHIGRNWGTPMSQKDEPELVISGPYRRACHPIYTGHPGREHRHRGGAELGVADRGGLAAVYFTYSAIVEERDLTEHFPDAYPLYRSSTKIIVPFVI
jgi:protein-S-isoprenylcysteine O-methyltransferase Ste14